MRRRLPTGCPLPGISRTRGSRPGTAITLLPNVIRLRQVSAKSATHSAAGHVGTRPHSSRRRVVSNAGRLSTNRAAAGRRGALAIGLPSAAAIARNVVCPSAATSIEPAVSPASSTARTMTRCTSCGCTTRIGRSIVSAVAVMTGLVNSRTSASSASRPTISADRTVIASPADGATTTRAPAVFDPASDLASDLASDPVSDPQYTTASAPAIAASPASADTKSTVPGQLSGRRDPMPTTWCPRLSSRAATPRPRDVSAPQTTTFTGAFPPVFPTAQSSSSLNAASRS